MSITPEVGRADPADAALTTRATFHIYNAKFFVPVITLSINDNIKEIFGKYKGRIKKNNF